jgi:hypothetical protein
MSDKLTNVLLPIWTFLTSPIAIAIISYIAGAITTLFAPWNKWFVEKRKLKLNNRKEKIHLWREELNKFTTISDFYKTPLYNELREYIPNKEQTKLFNNDGIEVIIGGPIGTEASTTESRIFERFHKVISDKEKEWDII